MSRHHAQHAKPVSRKVKAAGTLSVTAAAVTMSLGVAQAFWTAGGSGTASVQAANGLQLVATPGTLGTLLYPGASTDLVISINNPNPYAVSVSAIATGTPTTTTTACTTTGVTVGTLTGFPKTLAANTSTTVTFTNAVGMSSASVTGCQGATFTIPITSITGTS